MEAQAILTSDYLDILFHERNKKYGGYELRKNYTIRLQKALLLIMLLCGALTLLSLRKAERVTDALVVSARPTRLANVPTESPALPKPIEMRPPASTTVKASLHATPLKVVADKAVKDIESLPKQEPAGDPAGAPGNSLAGHIVSGKPGGLNDIIPPPSPITPPASTPVRYVEQMPQFDGLNEYLGSHLRYPEAAKENNVQGKVNVEFVVNEDGSISDARVVRGIGGGCDQEALRVVNAMPKWKPGKQNGKAVKVYLVLPIVFVLH